MRRSVNAAVKSRFHARSVTYTKSHSTRAVTVRLLDTSGGWGTLTSSLGGKLLSGSFSSSGFTGSLLGTGHGCSKVVDKLRVANL